jgi:integrase
MAKTWTDAKIAGLGAKDLRGKKERRLSVTTGLYLRLRAGMDGGRPTLSKRWEYRSKVDKRTRWLALGEYPGMGLAEAKRALEALQGKADQARKGKGDHPVLAARAERERNLSEPTTREVGEEWLAFAELRESTKALHRGNLEGDVYPRIGDARIKHVTHESYRDCVDAAVRRGARGQAAQVYKTLRTLVNFALKDRGYLETDPLANVKNPKPYNPRKVTPRAADDEELRVFLRLVNASAISPAVKQSIELQLLTGARPGEVRGARWDEINKARHVWRIPAERVKTGKAFDIHLSAATMALLARAKAIDSPEGFIFSGLRGGMVSKLAMARAMARLAKGLAEHKIERLKPHDLRRTFRTILARIQVAPHVAERCINHADGNPLDAVYNAHDYRPQMIAAWDQVGAHLEALQAGGAAVVPLKRSA